MQIANAPPSGAPSRAPAATTNFISGLEGQLILVVVGLGVLVLVSLSITLIKTRASADDTIRAYTLTLIIIGTLLLICASYSNDQIAPAIGLFGTVAGYLLGRKGKE